MIFITSDGKFAVVVNGVHHFFYSIMSYKKWEFIDAINLTDEKKWVFYSGRYIYIIDGCEGNMLISIPIQDTKTIRKAFYACDKMSTLQDMLHENSAKVVSWKLDDFNLAIALQSESGSRYTFNGTMYCDEVFSGIDNHKEAKKALTKVPIIDPTACQCLVMDEITTQWQSQEFKLVPYDTDISVNYGIIIAPPMLNKKIAMFIVV